jgi:hypothetical protein
MSDGHYCVVRDLGLVKGGKGMKHHEVVIDFNRRGMMKLAKHGIARVVASMRPGARLEEQRQVQADQGPRVSRRGMVALVKRWLTRSQRAELTRLQDLQEPSR